MAIIRVKDMRKMSPKEMEEKLKDLKLELIKSSVAANKTNAKTKEIKRAISRLITINKSRKGEELKNK